MTATSSNLDLTASVAAPFDSSQFFHTPYYCEENVYHLCKKLCTNGKEAGEGSDLFVVFISNQKKQIPLWHQKASQRADGITLWDYHVICVQVLHLCSDILSIAYNPLKEYDEFVYSFPYGEAYTRKHAPRTQFFRIVHAPIFLRTFASDRRHMKDSEGNYMYQPPAYEAIIAEDGTVHNLNEYIEMSAADVVQSIGPDLIDAVYSKKLGVLLSENQLVDFFSLIS